MDADIFRNYPVFPEPVAVKRGVPGCILYGIADPFIYEGIEIVTPHGLDPGREVGASRHISELMGDLFIDYCRPVRTYLS